MSRTATAVLFITFRMAYDVTLAYVWQNGLPSWRGSDSCLSGVRFILGYCCVAANITLLETGAQEKPCES